MHDHTIHTILQEYNKGFKVFAYPAVHTRTDISFAIRSGKILKPLYLGAGEAWIFNSPWALEDFGNEDRQGRWEAT
jgi:hypothetical protein